MRLLRVVPAALILCGPGPLFAQGWAEYASRADFFSVNFPGEPTVEELAYTSEYEAELPARVHAREDRGVRYSVTVVDYSEAEPIHTERAKNCPLDAHTGCSGASYTGVGSWIVDVRGAMDYATWGFLERDARPTFFGWNFVDLVEGRHLQLTNADGTRTFAAIYMHEDRLYILEATAPPGPVRPRAVPAVPAVHRRGRQPSPLRAGLRQRLSAASASQMMPFSTSTRISTPAIRSACRASARLCPARRASPAAPLAARPTPPGVRTVPWRGLLGLLGAAVIVLPGGAHHSHGNYELTDFTHLEGTVREVHLINPHSWIFLEVPGEEDGAAPTPQGRLGRMPARFRHAAARRPRRGHGVEKEWD